MFDYLFPIFCFGLVITGIVFLGILEAARQAKADSAQVGGREPGVDDFRVVPSHQPPVPNPAPLQ